MIEPPQHPQEKLYFSNLFVVERIWAEVHYLIPYTADLAELGNEDFPVERPFQSTPPTRLLQESHKFANRQVACRCRRPPGIGRVDDFGYLLLGEMSIYNPAEPTFYLG